MPSSVDSNEDDFDGRFDDLHRLIGDYGSAVAVSADLAAKGRAGANDCYALEKLARISLKSALLARLHPAGEAVAVKALEWEPYPFPEHAGPDVAVAHVKQFAHRYQVQRDPWGPGFIAYLHPTQPISDSTMWWQEKGFETIEVAKIAAQADYEQRIRSALAHPAPTAADTSGLVERAVAEAEEDGARMLNAERNAHIETSRHAVALAFGLRASEQQLAAAREQIAELDVVIADCAKACGAFVSPEASIEFKQMLPAEITAKIERTAQAALSSAHETIRATLDAIEEIPEYNTSDYEKIRLILAAVKRTRAALTPLPEGGNG